MERSLHRFVRLLRLRGVRVSVTEALDAMRATAQHGALGDRETLRCVLRVALVKDRRDQEVFDELFDRYFRLEPVAAPARHEHSHGHDHGAEARAERDAKDRPGRHDDNYYGAPTPAASVGSGGRAVPSGQGSRSFAQGLARRRAL